jgi:hypothetical protein
MVFSVAGSRRRCGSYAVMHALEPSIGVRSSACRLPNDEIISMIVDWITALIDTAPFLTRDHRGPWSKPLIQVYVVSNAFIALACLLIAVCLILIWKKRHRDMKCGWALVTFAAFIATCGFTNICNIAVFWWPAYQLLTLLSTVSAFLSLANVLWLRWLIGLASNLLTAARFRQITLELEDAIKLKDRAINDLNGTINVLHGQLNHLEHMRRTGLWVAEQETALRELKSALDSSFATEASP